MGEDESGDLKTPLKQSTLLKLLQFAFRNLIPERAFQIKAYNSTIIKICVKKESDLLLLEDFLETCKKGKRRCLNESKRARQKKAENKK